MITTQTTAQHNIPRRVIPALDLRAGQVVAGVGGRRAEYRPVRSVLANSAEPTELAAGLRDRLGLTELYVADLDALADGEPNWSSYTALAAAGHQLWVDIGVRRAADARALTDRGLGVVAGTETLPSPDALVEVLAAVGPERLVVSVDLRLGRPLGSGANWLGGLATGEQLLSAVLATGARRVLLLDVGRVGTSLGVELLSAAPRSLTELWVGGGVAGPSDLVGLRQAGVHAVLAATALHAGRVSAADCRHFADGG